MGASTRAWAVGLGAICAAGSILAQGKQSARAWINGGYWGGDVTYEIGGPVNFGNEVLFAPDPLSELTWPLGVGTMGGGLLVPLGTKGDFLFDGWGAVSDPTDPVENRDWLEPGVLGIYSESDAEITAFTLNAQMRYWFDVSGPAATAPVQLALGGGLAYQSFSWDALNVVQTYPFAPSEPADIVPGLVGTYDLEVMMPYLAVGLRVLSPNVRFTLTGGFAPYVEADDEDDHVLRSILAKTDATGIGGLGAAMLEVDLTERLFLILALQGFVFQADGTEYNVVYAGPEAGSRWSIDHEITSTQYLATAGLGLHL